MTYAELQTESVRIGRTRLGWRGPASSFCRTDPADRGRAGVWRCGGLVPLNTRTARELAHCLRHADVGCSSRCAASSPRLRRGARIAPGAAGARHPPDARLPALRGRLARRRGRPRTICAGGSVSTTRGGARAGGSPADAATIFFTSGDRQPGVVRPPRALPRDRHYPLPCRLAPEDRTWGYLPFFFTGGLVAVALATLARGGAVICRRCSSRARPSSSSQRNAAPCSSCGHAGEALIGHRLPRDRARLRKASARHEVGGGVYRRITTRSGRSG
jgi:hypothetical protein